MNKQIEAIQAMRRLESYDWPGNVRQLENTIERAVALESGPEISVGVLPDRVAGTAGAVAAGSGRAENFQIPDGGIDLERVIAETERRYLQAALDKAGGVRRQAAELLKISYRRSDIS